MNIQSQVLPTQISHIKQGQVTHTVYALIKDARFTEVIKLLESQISSYPKSRPLLSILAYSYYQIQDYTSATEYYLTLTKNFPDINEYQLYYAQSLYKSGQHVEAQKACFKVDSFDYSDKIVKLQAAIKFELGDLDGCGTLIDQSDQKDPEVIVDQACLLYKVFVYNVSMKSMLKLV